MRLLLLLLLTNFITSQTIAANKDFSHLVSFGPQGFGWSGAAERIDAKDNSSFEGVDHLLQEIGINYAHRIKPRLFFGGFYKSIQKDYKFDSKDGNTTASDLNTDSYGLFIIYNFNRQLDESFFLGMSTSLFNEEEENSGDFKNAENKDPFEIDDLGKTYELFYGRRFSLKKWNIDHLTYSPQIGLFYRTHGKDFDDQGITDGLGFSIQVIKFDFLF